MLINDRKVGVDHGLSSLYPIREASFEIKGTKYKGTYKSYKCLGFTRDAERQACQFCSSIHKLDSFKLRLQCRQDSIDESGKRNTSTIRNDYLTHDEVDNKVTRQGNVIRSKDSE